MEATLSKANGVSLPKIPTLTELVNETEQGYKENALMVILNQPPPDAWLKEHPMIKGYKYLPINRVEYLLSRIYTKWWVDIKSIQTIANSTVVIVRLFVVNPITREVEFQDGLGAAPIQTNAGAGAMDWNAAKADGVMKSAPAAESYAIKDAAEKFGKLFGKDLGRKDTIAYDSLLKQQKLTPKKEDLEMLLSFKKETLTAAELKDANRILKNSEAKSYKALLTLLNAK